MPYKKYVIIETIVSVILNGIVTALFAYVAFSGAERIGLWGTGGLAVDLVPTTFMISLMTCLGLTLITRRRVRRGLQLIAPAPPRWFAKALLVRAATLGAGTAAILVPVTVAALAILWQRDWFYDEVMVFKLAYSTALSLAITPAIILAAIADAPLPAGAKK